MKMAKASEADMKMALELSSMLEGFERGHFPEEDGEFRDFDESKMDHRSEALEMIFNKVRAGSLFRVAFGMSVLLDPKNEAIDHSLDYLEHHPKVKAHDELVAALRSLDEVVDDAPEANCSCHVAPPCSDCVENSSLREAKALVRAVLAKEGV